MSSLDAWVDTAAFYLAGVVTVLNLSSLTSVEATVLMYVDTRICNYAEIGWLAQGDEPPRNPTPGDGNRELLWWLKTWCDAQDA